MRIFLLASLFIAVIGYGAYMLLPYPSAPSQPQPVAQTEAEHAQSDMHDDHEDDHDHAEGGIPEKHIHVETPATLAEAQQMIANEYATIKAAWDAHDYNTIHVSSYSLEAALTRYEEVAAEQGNEPALEQLAHAQKLVYTVHHASENALEGKLATEVPALIQALETLPTL